MTIPGVLDQKDSKRIMSNQLLKKGYSNCFSKINEGIECRSKWLFETVIFPKCLVLWFFHPQVFKVCVIIATALAIKSTTVISCLGLIDPWKTACLSFSWNFCPLSCWGSQKNAIFVLMKSKVLKKDIWKTLHRPPVILFIRSDWYTSDNIWLTSRPAGGILLFDLKLLQAKCLIGSCYWRTSETFGSTPIVVLNKS